MVVAKKTQLLYNLIEYVNKLLCERSGYMNIGAIGLYGNYNYYDNYGINNAAEDGDKAAVGVRRSSPAECQTCKERKYQDGSNENVSFKQASHISPNAAGAAVRAHEGEHVTNAYAKASEKGGKVISASVSIHTAVCPECGRTYVSGGETNTTIKYSNEDNPYQQNRKQSDAARFIGNNFDYTV